ncbi:MAG TPA: VWA domain-containing protein [Vicinamibacterales bacterium]|nr:VWA domain-containing protein [Vicinamibacterales bacterium]
MSPVRVHTFARLAIVCAIAAFTIQPFAAAAGAITRTVYVTITDDKGAAVTDLTPANFKVKEGGKDREIVKAAPATVKPRLALMIEERLVGDYQARLGLFEFVKRMNGIAEISLIGIGLSNTTIVPFVTDTNALLKGINELTLNGQPTSNLTECLADMAKIFQKEKPERPVMVVVAFSGGQAGGASAHAALTEIRQSGATLYAVTFGPPSSSNNNNPNLGTMGDESGREQVLGDGAKQSGGRRTEVVTTAAIQKALQQVADDLAAQYQISYALPDGVKPDKRFNVSIDRKGLSVRAPQGLPDK